MARGPYGRRKIARLHEPRNSKTAEKLRAERHLYDDDLAGLLQRISDEWGTATALSRRRPSYLASRRARQASPGCSATTDGTKPTTSAPGTR